MKYPASINSTLLEYIMQRITFKAARVTYTQSHTPKNSGANFRLGESSAKRNSASLDVKFRH